MLALNPLSATDLLTSFGTIGVTLPGVFLGVPIGSGSPVQPGAAQVLVLIGLLAAEAVAAVVTVELVARGRIRRSAGALTDL